MRLPSPLVCAVALAAVLAAVHAVRGRPAPPEGTTPDDRIDDRIVGTVGGPVIAAPHGFGAPLDTGDTVVWIWTDARVLPGERIAVTGRLRTPRGMLDPGSPDRAVLAATRGAAWELTASHLERLADDPGWLDLAWRWAAGAQAAWVHAIDDATERGDPGGAALRGIVTGDRGDVPDALDRRWRAVGIYHVLSVSGLHLAVVAGLAFLLLRRLIAASPWGGRVRPARWAAPPALVLAVAYTLVTGAQLATVRSLIVVVVMLVAQILDRPARLVDALGVAAIVVLAWRPSDLYDPSFELSFVAALTLALRPTSLPGRSRVVDWIARGATTSAWVAITTAPITAYHFHQVAAGGVIGNLVLTPLVELVALPLGIAGLVLPGGSLLIGVAAWVVGRVDQLAGLLARVTPVGVTAIGSPLVMAVLVAVGVALAARPRRTRVDVACWIALCFAWTLGRTPPPAGALRVTFVDVGQGDAAIIELPDGAVWLVDAGGLPNGGDAATSPGRAVAGVLDVYGHTAIDLAIVSHPHPDHYLGFAALAERMPIGELWSVDEAALDARGPREFDAIAATLVAHGTRLAHPPLGVARVEAGVELVVWAPRYSEDEGAAPVEGADPVRTVNDNSLVVALRFAGRTIVFSGDLEAEGERALVDAGLHDVDVVKVAHHGSPTSSSAAYVAATHPRIAVISCGVANQFHFPSPAVVERWRAAGADVERTDESGAVTITISAWGALTVDRFAR